MHKGDLFVGPAVVVDDKIEDESAGMTAIVDQIEEAGVPVLKRTQLPPSAEVPHWRGFALILLDWELISTGEPGVAVPDSLREQNDQAVSEFVATLLTELYCPVFVLSNQNVDEIHDALAERLGAQADQIPSRVLVRSKSSVLDGVLDELETWVRSHPAVYALKSWEFGYHDARRQMFADFELSSGDWPRILWETSEKDKTNPHFELAETIGRNILHRFEPLVFDEEALQAESASSSVDALRRVIHRRAVVPASSLHDDVVMPGDFFRASDVDDSESDAFELLINVTPACDLVPRSDESGDVSMTVLRAQVIPAEDVGSKNKREKMRKHPDPTSEVVWVFREDGRPYRVAFKGWSEVSWLEHRPRRVGRLIEPYITQLQQRFALHFHRQGVPRLPDSFYDGD